MTGIVGVEDIDSIKFWVDILEFLPDPTEKSIYPFLFVQRILEFLNFKRKDWMQQKRGHNYFFFTIIYTLLRYLVDTLTLVWYYSFFSTLVHLEHNIPK